MPSDTSRPSERRAEARRPAHGPIVLRAHDVAAGSVTGSLVDIARSGFRARHTLPTLSPGQVVDFEIGGFPGRARVVWTRIQGARVESGFLILTGSSE